MPNPAGTPRSHDESNCLPSAHLTPTYCTTTRSPLRTAAPAPFTTGTATSVVGGAPPGSVIAGLPADVPTVGRPAAGFGAGEPDAELSGGTVASRSTTKTSVS